MSRRGVLQRSSSSNSFRKPEPGIPKQRALTLLLVGMPRHGWESERAPSWTRLLPYSLRPVGVAVREDALLLAYSPIRFDLWVGE